MLGISELRHRLAQVFNENQTDVLFELIALIYEQVMKAMDLSEVKAVIKELAEAQRRTEERLSEFEKRTEENFARVWETIEKLTVRVDELTIRLDKLTERIDQLAEAQRKTEERLNELTERVNQLTIRVDQLAEAQREMAEKMSKLIDAQTQLEDSLAKLLGRMKTTEERIEWIFNSIGFTIEDKSLKALPELLKKEGITVEGNLIRRYYKIGSEYNQLNIYGWGRKDGEKVLILGEIKTRASKKEINEFIKLADKIRKSEGNPAMFLIFVAYDYRPEVEEYLKEKGIKYFWSYELS